MSRTKEQIDETLNMIRALEASGVLDSEQCPNPDYWHWPVLIPEMLPDCLKSNFTNYGEIRFYW